MRRREFITLLGGAVVAWPLAARAQQPDRVRRIGVLVGLAKDDAETKAWLAGFRQGLERLGWSEGRNVRIDLRFAPAVAQVQVLAKELIALQPDLILSTNTPTTASLLQQTRTIPIIFANVSDPIGSGFVASLPRPGGNVTGFINIEASLASKWLELLKEIAPRVASVAFLFNPATAPDSGSYFLGPFKAAAPSFRVEAISAPVHDTSEFESVVAAQAQTPNSGLIVMPGAFLTTHRAEITSLAARYHLPAVYPYRNYTELGGLLSYGNDLVDNFRRAAIYADRILKGAKPSELPVQVPVKFELVINLKTAKALGLDVPWQLQQRADEVIE
jgi:putative tryptophan/tyrosine transport system substrate-binding protein